MRRVDSSSAGYDKKLCVCRLTSLHNSIRFFIFNWFFSWVILLPVDAVNSGGTKDGLERFTFGNVGRSHQDRYWAHLVLAYLFAFYAFYLINKNMAHFVQLRHSFLTSPARARLAQSKTVLVTGIVSSKLSLEVALYTAQLNFF